MYPGACTNHPAQLLHFDGSGGLWLLGVALGGGTRRCAPMGQRIYLAPLCPDSPTLRSHNVSMDPAKLSRHSRRSLRPYQYRPCTTASCHRVTRSTKGPHLNGHTSNQSHCASRNSSWGSSCCSRSCGHERRVNYQMLKPVSLTLGFMVITLVLVLTRYQFVWSSWTFSHANAGISVPMTRIRGN